MNITIHSKGIELLEEEKTYAKEKAETLLHRANCADEKEDVSVKIEIDREKASKDSKHQFFCSVTVNIPGKTLRAEHRSGGVYTAIDDAMESLRRQLKKEKEKHVHL